jgi:hypothetical protein
MQLPSKLSEWLGLADERIEFPLDTSVDDVVSNEESSFVGKAATFGGLVLALAGAPNMNVVQAEDADEEDKSELTFDVRRHGMLINRENGVVIGGRGRGKGVHFDKGDYGFIHLKGGRTGITYKLGENVVTDNLGDKEKVTSGDPQVFYDAFKKHLANHDYQRGEKVLGILLKENRDGALKFIDGLYKEHPDEKSVVLAKGISMYLGGEAKGAEDILYSKYASDRDPQWAIGLVRSYEVNMSSEKDPKELSSLHKWASRRSKSAQLRLKRFGLHNTTADSTYVDNLCERNK